MIVCSGCVIVSEVFSVFDVGVQVLKIFLLLVFGLDYIKVLKVVFLFEVLVFVVGGVMLENLVQWINVGCVGVGLGSDFYCVGQLVECIVQQVVVFVKVY